MNQTKFHTLYNTTQITLNNGASSDPYQTRKYLILDCYCKNQFTKKKKEEEKEGGPGQQQIIEVLNDEKYNNKEQQQQQEEEKFFVFVTQCMIAQNNLIVN